MSKEPRDSSGSVGFNDRNKISGLPKHCWCGEKVLLKTSKSDNNTNQSYFRCAFVAFNELRGNKHLFKWLDDAMLSEIDVLKAKIATLDEIVKEIMVENKEIEKLFERFEEFMLQKIDDVLVESKRKLKSAIIVSFSGIFLIVFVSAMMFLK